MESIPTPQEPQTETPTAPHLVPPGRGAGGGGRQSTRRTVLLVAGLLLAAGGLVLAVIFGSRLGAGTLVASPLIGQPVPPLELPYLESDGTLALQDLQGEIVVVNFWASWCAACRAEHPALIDTAAAYREFDVRFVGIVYQDRPSSAIAMLDELGREYDYVDDPTRIAAVDFGVFGVPETFFIDRDGVIVGKITGESNRQLLAATLDEIILGRMPGSRTTGTVQPGPDG